MPLIQQNNVFIDPEQCGSSAGYYIFTNEHTNSKTGKTVHSISGTVVLADCSHKIDWSFGNSDEDLPKIDAAIKILQEFRKKYSETQKMVQKLNQ